jgi:hypothetical protein
MKSHPGLCGDLVSVASQAFARAKKEQVLQPA